MTKNALVLDAETRSALAVTRSLGLSGVTVIAASSERKPLAGASRFCRKVLHCPSAVEDREGFKTWLRETVREFRPAVTLPVTDASLHSALTVDEELREYTAMPFVPRDTFLFASDKHKLGDAARKAGLKVPATVVVDSLDGLQERLEQAQFPAFIKGRCGVAETAAALKKAPMNDAANIREAIKFFSAQRELLASGVDFLVQQKIEGEGVGVFALMFHGEPLVLFCHRRLLEKPPSGGVSVLCESLPLREAPIDEALRLLTSLKWHGVAMVEFKRDRDAAWLMEINPRFWGSLELALAAGRDFPWLLYQLALCGSETEIAAFRETCRTLPPYKEGLRSRWLFGTIDHALSRIKRERFAALRDIAMNNALRLGEGAAVWETYRSQDPSPFWRETALWFSSAVGFRK